MSSVWISENGLNSCFRLYACILSHGDACPIVISRFTSAMHLMEAVSGYARQATGLCGSMLLTRGHTLLDSDGPTVLVHISSFLCRSLAHVDESPSPQQVCPQLLAKASDDLKGIMWTRACNGYHPCMLVWFFSSCQASTFAGPQICVHCCTHHQRKPSLWISHDLHESISTSILVGMCTDRLMAECGCHSKRAFLRRT